jgi:hypothetical protein
MGGGGGGAAPAPAPVVPATPQIPVADFEAFSPGQQGLLAEQMQAGYGGVLSDYTGQMDHYRDMRVPLLNSPGDIPNYLKNVGLEVTAGGTPANPQAFYDATRPGYQLPASGTPVPPQPVTGLNLSGANNQQTFDYNGIPLTDPMTAHYYR